MELTLLYKEANWGIKMKLIAPDFMKTRIYVSALVVLLVTLTSPVLADWELYGPITPPGLGGTYWSLSRGTSYPPLPCIPLVFSDAPVYGIVGKPGNFVYDDSENPSHDSFTANSFSSASFPSGPGGGTPLGDWPSPDPRRNYEKFAALGFAVLNTNNVAATDTNLYNVIASFPPDTNTSNASNLTIR
jgi:hypothetical protein